MIINNQLESSKSAQIASIAELIAVRGMTMPAIFFLELHKPFSTLISAAITFSQPLIDALMGRQRARELIELLSSRESIEALIVALEGQSKKGG